MVTKMNVDQLERAATTVPLDRQAVELAIDEICDTGGAIDPLAKFESVDQIPGLGELLSQLVGSEGDAEIKTAIGKVVELCRQRGHV